MYGIKIICIFIFFLRICFMRLYFNGEKYDKEIKQIIDKPCIYSCFSNLAAGFLDGNPIMAIKQLFERD